MRFSEDVELRPGTAFGEGVLTSVNGKNGLAFIERKAGLGIGDVVTVSGVPATLAALEFGDGLEDEEEVVEEAPVSEKERKAAKLKAMQEKLAAAGLAKTDEESEAERKAKKLAAMREKLAAAGLAPADDSSEPDAAAAAEAARKAAKLQAMREKLAAAGLPTPD